MFGRDRHTSFVSTGSTGRRPFAWVVALLALWLCLGALPHAPAAPSAAAEGSPAWEALSQLRLSLQAQSPLNARFRQTFVPLDFDEGEVEEGVLAISLPKCLRWDYSGDFAKSFLLCDDWAYTWHPGDPKGRRTRVDEPMALDAPGLDFFLLDLDTLQERYAARVLSPDSGGPKNAEIRIELKALDPQAEVPNLEVTLDADARQLLVLGFVDREGNRTTFEIRDYKAGTSPGTFSPPAELEWEDS